MALFVSISHIYLFQSYSMYSKFMTSFEILNSSISFIINLILISLFDKYGAFKKES